MTDRTLFQGYDVHRSLAGHQTHSPVALTLPSSSFSDEGGIISLFLSLQHSSFFFVLHLVPPELEVYFCNVTPTA